MAYTNNDIYNLVNFIIRKDSKGQPLTRENFSLQLDIQGLAYFEELYDQYEREQEITDSLRRFKVTNSSLVAYSTNSLTLPTNYAHSGYLYYKKGGTDVKPVYLVDDDKFMMRQDSFIEEPTSDYPIARFTTDYIEYLPSTLDENNFTFSYLRYPNTPYYDYYIDANGVVQYLAEDEVHSWSAGEYDSSGNLKVGTEPNYTSLTEELDFNEEDKLKVAYKILKAVSIPIDEAGVFQYATEQKLES